MKVKGKQTNLLRSGRDTFRIESSHPIQGPLWPVSGKNEFHVRDHGLAVVLAAKSVTDPPGGEIRVVHVPTGEVVFSKHNAPTAPPGDY